VAGRRKLVPPSWTIITIHTTNFFRERNHFDYLRKNKDALLRNNPLVRQRFEIPCLEFPPAPPEKRPFSPLGAMVLREALTSGFSLKILATDESRDLSPGGGGVVSVGDPQGCEPYFLQK
jgi:chemotaxis protein methyltransferase CheR